MWHAFRCSLPKLLKFPMKPDAPDLKNDPIDPLKKPAPAAKEPEPEPGLGVDWGSNIDPGPGRDPRAIEPGGHRPGRDRAA